MADLTPQELEEFEFRLRLEQEQETPSQQKEQSKDKSLLEKAKDNATSQFLTTAGLTGAGYLAGPAIKETVQKYGVPGLTELPKQEIVKPPTFKSPTEVATQAIQNRTPSVTAQGVPSAVETYNRTQYVNPEGKGLYYGAGETGEYSGSRKAAAEAIAAEKRFPGMKSIEGGRIPFSVPESIANELKQLQEAEKVALASKNQAEVNKIAQIRADRLKAIEEAYAAKNIKPTFLQQFAQSPLTATRGGIERGGEFMNRMISPQGQKLLGSRLFGALGGLDVGLQGTSAIEHFGKGEIGRGIVNTLGAIGGAAAMTRHPLLMPIGMGVSMASPFVNTYLDKIAKEHPNLHLASGGQPNVKQIESNISPQEQAIVDYHRNTIASGNIGRDDHNNPVTVYSSTVDIPSGLHAGKVATVPGYYDNQIHNDPREIYAKWAEQIDQGKWPIYYDPRTGDTRAKYIHGIMDQEKPHFLFGGSVDTVGPTIGPAQVPGMAGTLATTETPVGLIPSNLNDFVTGGGKFDPTTNQPTGGLSGLLAGNNPTAPATPAPYKPMPATLAEYQAQLGDGPRTTALDPWAGTTDANGTWVRNPDQAAAYAAYAAQQNATQGGQIPATPNTASNPTTNSGLMSLLLNAFKSNAPQVQNANALPPALKQPAVSPGLKQPMVAPGLNQPTPQMNMPTRRFGMPLQTRHQVVRKPQGYFR